MKQSLRFKITASMLAIALFGIFLTSFTIFFGVENNFINYLKESRDQRIGQIEREATESYQESGKLVSDQLVSIIREQAMMDNIYYQIYDKEGEEVLDSSMMRGMMHGQGMQRQSTTVDEYQNDGYDLDVSGQTIGSMVVAYPVELVGAEYDFLTTIRRNIFLAVVVTVLLSILFSVLFSKQIAKGFQRLAEAIQRLRTHRGQEPIKVEALTKEMRPLGEAFNQLAESLIKEEKLRKQFTADLAHELRTPLATLRSQMEAYQDGVWEPTAERLAQSHQELMRLVRLVNELEKLIAAENPQMQLEKTTIDANELLEQMVRQFAPTFYDKGVQLHGKTTNNQPTFQADRDKVVQILTNMINNALQYTPETMQVTITIEQQAGFVGFVVADQGTGIADKDIPHLFERFYRGDKSRDRTTGGIGVGLAIVKALVDAHQGKVELSSELGSGTTIRVLFPVEA